MSSSNITELSDATFAEEIEQHAGTAVVDFWAPWCGPCRAVGPILKKLAGQYAGQIKVAKLNVDTDPLTPGRFGIRSIPTLLFFRDGKVVDGVVGALPQATLDQRFRAVASPPAGCACCG